MPRGISIGRNIRASGQIATGRSVATNRAIAEDVAASPVTLLSDGFSGTNGDNIDGRTPDTVGSNPYSALIGSGDIQSNTLRGSTTPHTTIVNDVSDADVTITVSVNTGADADSSGVSFRVVDASNFWFARIEGGGANLFRLFKCEGGSFTEMDSEAFTVANNTVYSISVTTNGTSITATVNGGTPLSTTSSFNQSATQHGTYVYPTASNTERFDNLVITSV